jgi:glycolate oxidase FAD binding subunit
VDLIHPSSKADVAEAVRGANADGRRLLVVGGRRHIDKGNPSEIDAELWTTQLDRVVAYDPAEMIAVVEAGMRVHDLEALLSEGGQEWPCDAPGEATVGGVIATATSSPRRLRVGAVRDTVLEVELVTGDGRLVRGGARTVKNVTGYDLPRLATGSLGTLGVITQVALKLRPLPKARVTLAVGGDGLRLGSTLLDSVPLPAAVLASAAGVELRLEGWPEEVESQSDIARKVLDDVGVHDVRAADQRPFPAVRPWDEGVAIVAEASVAPSHVSKLVEAAGGAWGAPLGIGLVWSGLVDEPALDTFREATAALGGIAPVLRGPGGLGDAPVPAGDVQRRLKSAFDPSGILAPGRFWGGI